MFAVGFYFELLHIIYIAVINDSKNKLVRPITSDICCLQIFTEHASMDIKSLSAVFTMQYI